MKSIFSLCIMAACACTSPVWAGNLVDVTVIDNTTGERLTTWRYQGHAWVAGQPGHRYSVELNNRSGGRVLTVMSVDGVNVLTGQTAATAQSGYVLSPWSASEIRGWRKSLDESARFYFTSVADSYAGRTGRPDNAGVIGIAVYREKIAEPLAEYSAPAAPLAKSEESRRRAASGAALQDGLASRPAEKLATGHGERITDPTRYVDFERAGTAPDEIVEIRYDAYANLVARGMIPRPYRHREPNAFPGSFVPDPS